MIAGGMMPWCQKDCPNEWLPFGLEWFTGDSFHSWNGILNWMACSWTSINRDISPEETVRCMLLLHLSRCREPRVRVWERGSGRHCHWCMKCKTYLWGFTPCLDPSAYHFTHPYSKIVMSWGSTSQYCPCALPLQDERVLTYQAFPVLLREIYTRNVEHEVPVDS